jgi:hypothetical protein
VADLFNTKLNTPDNNEIDDTTHNNKPIPFLIRNTTAQGMPISIGALRPVNSSPKFQSFNSFIKRLPPPQKYVFETRQVLAGDVVDPYNYLRALFRGEVTCHHYSAFSLSLPVAGQGGRKLITGTGTMQCTRHTHPHHIGQLL